MVGEPSTYGECLRRLFANPEFQRGKVASNMTFSAIDIPVTGKGKPINDQRSMVEGVVTVKCNHKSLLHTAF